MKKQIFNFYNVSYFIFGLLMSIIMFAATNNLIFTSLIFLIAIIGTIGLTMVNIVISKTRNNKK